MPRLVIRKGDGVGKDHALGGECVVGRQPGVTFVLEDLLASRRHFRVFQEDSAWWAEDLGSTNGTLVNGRKIAGKQKLGDGDVIAAGNTEMQFVQKDLLGGAAPGAAPKTVVAPAVPGTGPGATSPSPLAKPPPAPPKPAASPAGAKKLEAPVPRKRRER